MLDLQSTGAVNLASLTTGNGSSLGVTIADGGHTLYNVAGAATFGEGTKILVTLDRVGTAAGNYTIIDAGSLAGAGNLTSSVVTLPFLFQSELTADATTGQVTLEHRAQGQWRARPQSLGNDDPRCGARSCRHESPFSSVFLSAASSADVEIHASAHAARA